MLHRRGKNISIHPTAMISGENIFIHDNVQIGKDTKIIANDIVIHANTVIGANNKFEVADGISIGMNSVIGNDNNIHTRAFVAGTFLYMGSKNEIGGGGSNGMNSKIIIGDHCMIVDKTTLNTSETITIGDDVGIGSEVMIWTHGSFNSVLDGFPASFAPVKIGSHVWLPARCIVLPGVTIGDNVVVGIGSLVNKPLEDGCLAGGIPAKILKSNQYPKKLSGVEIDNLCNHLVKEYKSTLIDKGLDNVNINYRSDGCIFGDQDGYEQFLFNVRAMIWSGTESEIFEDLRDFLRRHGIKFYTTKPFKPFKPVPFRLLEKYKPFTL